MKMNTEVIIINEQDEVVPRNEWTDGHCRAAMQLDELVENGEAPTIYWPHRTVPCVWHLTYIADGKQYTVIRNTGQYPDYENNPPHELLDRDRVWGK